MAWRTRSIAVWPTAEDEISRARRFCTLEVAQDLDGTITQRHDVLFVALRARAGMVQVASSEIHFIPPGAENLAGPSCGQDAELEGANAASTDLTSSLSLDIAQAARGNRQQRSV